jgi:hypothetical protein
VGAQRQIVEDLAERITAAWGDWDGPVVESVVFGTRDPVVIASMIDRWAEQHLGAPLDAVRWYHASVGCSCALALADGREVVVKAHQPRFGETFLRSATSVQEHLAASFYPCPRPLAGPNPIGNGWATAAASIADPGETAVPDMTSAVAALVRLTTYVDGMAHCGYSEGRVNVGALAPHPLGAPSNGTPYPEPYSPAFEFRNDGSAAWIDDLARCALDACTADQGPLVVSHGDWSPRNVRGDRFGVTAVFDLDSLVLTTEARAAGHAAASWLLGNDDSGSGLDVDTISHFLWLHQRIRDYWFPPHEARAAWGAALWNLAHLARCEHAMGEELAATRALRLHGAAITERCLAAS